MQKALYITIQKKYPGKLVAISKRGGKVVVAGKSSQEVEKELKRMHVKPESCLFLGPVERYNQISVY